MATLIRRIHANLITQAIEAVGSDKSGVEIMSKKSEMFAFRIANLPFSATMILKQEAIARGADFATSKDCILAKKTHYDGVLLGSKSQLLEVIKKCRNQPFGLKKLADSLSFHFKKYTSSQKWNKPKIMGIINVTSDSFFVSSRRSASEAIKRVYTLLEKNVEMIDIGGVSSRPGSELVASDEEIIRLEKVIEEIYRQNLNKEAIFSIDTYNPKTADFALSKGFSMLNDISGYQNFEMIKIAAAYNANALLMHSRGIPKNMQNLAFYENLFTEIDEFFDQKIQQLKAEGVHEIVLDIGFGFAKKSKQNISLIQNLAHFKHFGYPLLVGASRKNTLGLLTGRGIEDRLAATLAIHLLAVQNGANILRVHDEDEHIDILKIYEAMQIYQTGLDEDEV